MEDGKLFGFLNIYKPVGMTSHDVVGMLRRITGIKQIGHAGTLDPFAEGVLPVAIGKATRLIEYLNDDKAYVGRFNFGKATATYDIEGDVVKTFEDKVSENDIINNLPNGIIEQYPPIYSAKKINGKKMYELARAGLDIEVKPCSVTVYESKLVGFNFEEQFADIYIKCSKGTYIRSIANDLGKVLNNGCYLSKLKRVQSGLFCVGESVMLESLETELDVAEKILNPIDFLPYFVQELDETEYKKVSHGMNVYNKSDLSAGIVLLVKEGNLIAISEILGKELKPKKVMI